MIFDGKAFAKEIEEKVKEGVASLSVKPLIVSILVGDDPASVLYTRLKREAAERIGIGFEISHLTNESLDQLKINVAEIGGRADVTGVMVQMPIPGLSREEQEVVLKAIPLEKDVDGLRWEESGMMPATVKAIIAILDKIKQDSLCDVYQKKFVVVGTHGSVGRPLVHFLKEKGVKAIEEVNSDTPDQDLIIKQGEVVISCVGRPGLVKEIKEGAIAVDVGISKVGGKTVGDMTPNVYNTTSVAVPVPGGVGPVTIACLIENVVSIYEKMHRGSVYM